MDLEYQGAIQKLCKGQCVCVWGGGRQFCYISIHSFRGGRVIFLNNYVATDTQFKNSKSSSLFSGLGNHKKGKVMKFCANNAYNIIAIINLLIYCL